MAGVQEQQPQQADNVSQESMERDFAKKLVNTFDLGEGLMSAVDGEVIRQRKEEAVEETEPKEEVVEEEQQEEAVTEEKSQETEETEETEETPVEDSEEDLIPKSKVQKRIDELTKQNKKFEAELRALKESNATPKSSRDEDLEKLEAMNETELRTLRREIKMAQLNMLDANLEPTQRKAELAKLMELDEKAEKAITSAPQRFQSTQVAKFNEAVEYTDIEPKAKEAVFGYAKTIFLSSPELQSSVTGQARAWEMAVQHYTEINKLTKGKVQADELKRQNTTLKKKISVDTSSQKSAQKPNDDARLFKKAQHGNFDDKVAFFRKKMNVDSMIPEEYRQRG